ncbi:MAG: 2-oxoglutarate dehydrogenase complex dihydrolipoyllysine-residue succinyltransferase [Microscillaceae bacterium]|nr:2-oxoglutarate dehydrogenase complex dihydrolipoyllysine-residue succinyltransferase [Microscillaceae bacterium]
MHVEIVIPAFAESITEVTIGEWLKKDGDAVKLDEEICEVETDKASQQLLSPANGILKITVQSGETVNVGTVIGMINTNSENTPTSTPQITTSSTSTDPVVPAATQPTPTGQMQVVEMLVPNLAESITEVVIGTWLKKDGDLVELDEEICEVETDKATQPLPAEARGILRIVAQEGTTLPVGGLICRIEVSDAATGTAQPQTTTPTQTSSETPVPTQSGTTTYATGHPSPAASKILAEKGINPAEVEGTGVDGRITKEDSLKAQKTEPKKEVVSTPVEKTATTPEAVAGNRTQRRSRMSQLRKTIARRLVAVKNETAMLTTFNECNMKPVMDLRNRFKDEFKEKYGVGLGFMSFFAKACAQALIQFPEVNAMIDEGEIVYHDYVDISVAVSTDRGLVVPVLRNVENMSFYEIEKGIVDLAAKARDGKLTIEDMQGGTFTITNGGIFGSMMSTPIINAPQSAILGMHNIVQRPFAVNGEVKILPMMYLALSYDHRIIDGKEAVGFLVAVKKYVEEPERLLFGV